MDQVEGPGSRPGAKVRTFTRTMSMDRNLPYVSQTERPANTPVEIVEVDGFRIVAVSVPTWPTVSPSLNYPPSQTKTTASASKPLESR